MTYKEFTIEEDFRNPYSNKPDFMIYKTSEGIQHDADCDQDGFFYTGNCIWRESLQDAKDTIDEISEMPDELTQVEIKQVLKNETFIKNFISIK